MTRKANDGEPGRVLVVDRDDEIRRVVTELLERAGFDVVVATDRSEAVWALFSDPPDAIVLDDDAAGRTLSQIRDVSDVPILVRAASAAETEKVQALRRGADDYVTNAMGRREFVARVEALVRRGRSAGRRARAYADDVLAIDFAGRRVVVDGREVELTPLEFRLLTTLVGHAGVALGHSRLAELVWGATSGVDPDAIRLYVSYLRSKLGEPARRRIETVRGFGYRYRRRSAETELRAPPEKPLKSV